MCTSTRLVSILIVLALAASCGAISCWKCGQYSDGVGSITPCNNRSAARLEECPRDHKFCIKYVSELTTVRDCVPTCSEKACLIRSPHPSDSTSSTNSKNASRLSWSYSSVEKVSTVEEVDVEWWGARTYCCDTDECNSTPAHSSSMPVVIFGLTSIVFSLRQIRYVNELA